MHKGKVNLYIVWAWYRCIQNRNKSLIGCWIVQLLLLPGNHNRFQYYCFDFFALLVLQHAALLKVHCMHYVLIEKEAIGWIQKSNSGKWSRTNLIYGSKVKSWSLLLAAHYRATGTRHVKRHFSLHKWPLVLPM